MKNALLLSFSFHIAAGLVWSLVVKITQVRFVPRQVYTVNIVTPAEIPKPANTAPVVTEAQPKPEPEQKVEEEMAPPPEKPKPKPKPAKPEQKEVKKAMPTKEPQTAEPTPEAEPEPEPVTTGDIALGQEFPFAYYITNMRRKIAGFWQVPGQSAEERYCVVHFEVLRSGSIISPSIETSSGNLLFDQAALRAVHQASPLPALPPGFGEDRLGVHFSFAYRKE